MFFFCNLLQSAGYVHHLPVADNSGVVRIFADKKQKQIAYTLEGSGRRYKPRKRAGQYLDSIPALGRSGRLWDALGECPPVAGMVMVFWAFCPRPVDGPWLQIPTKSKFQISTNQFFQISTHSISNSLPSHPPGGGYIPVLPKFDLYPNLCYNIYIRDTTTCE